MKSFLHSALIISILFVFNTHEAKAQSWLWAKSIGGTGDDNGSSTAIDPLSGDIYTTGWFSGTVDFNPGPGTFNLTSIGSSDIYISKLDGTGNFIWARAMGSTGNDGGIAIALGLNGDIFTTGWFSGTVDFDPGAGIFNLNGPGIFISKLDISGNFVWAKAIGSASVNSIAVDGSGNVYTTGSFVGDADFDPGPGTYYLNSGAYGSMFISKLDSTGEFVWAKLMTPFAGQPEEYVPSVVPRSIALDLSGGAVYTTGFCDPIIDFDPGVAEVPYYSPALFISTLDDSGNYLGIAGHIGYGDSYSIAVDQVSGAVYTAGYVGADIFISSETFGEIIIGGTGVGIGTSIALDPTGSGSAYITGLFSGTVDFDPGGAVFNLTSAGDYDIFILKLDGSGNFAGAIAVGGTGTESGSSIALDAEGNVVIVGNFYSSTITFGSTTLTNSGGRDVFIAKFDPPCNNIVTNTGNSGSGSLRDVISCVSSGATINFSLAPMSQITLTTGEIDINKNLIISGSGMFNLSLSGNNASRIFHLLPGNNLEIENLTLKNATSLTNGGAIYSEGNLTLENILLQNNFENGAPKAMTISPGGFVTILGNVEINQ